jgi:hypothetical protein
VQIDVFRGVASAGLADFGRLHLGFLSPQFLIHFDLDRQAVTVPARHKRRVEARHAFRLDHKVLQNLVESRAEMDVSVGVRWTIVQCIDRGILAQVAQAIVEFSFFPALEDRRLRLGQVRLHRKAGFGKIDRALEVHRSGHSQSPLVQDTDYNLGNPEWRTLGLNPMPAGGSADATFGEGLSSL